MGHAEESCGFYVSKIKKINADIKNV